jgi:hypothetical protein
VVFSLSNAPRNHEIIVGQKASRAHTTLLISTPKKCESKTIHQFTFGPPPPRLHPCRAFTPHNRPPPDIFFRPRNRPRRHPSTSIVPITPVDPPPPTPSICLEDAQLSVPARISVPSGGSCGVEVIKRSAVREQTACAGAGQPRLVAAAAS